MKRQYLGDSNDSFKWDYHDYLMAELRYPLLNVALMMTPDDNGKHGRSSPDLFPAEDSVLDICRDLKNSRDIEGIKDIPRKTGTSYQLTLHKNGSYLTNNNRDDYFSGFDSNIYQIVFLDPDNGFEPKKKYSEKHLLYRDVTRILGQLSDNSIIIVYQHFRRVSFPLDFARIRERLGMVYSTAIYWHTLMFVAISSSEQPIKRVVVANKRYEGNRPVQLVD